MTRSSVAAEAATDDDADAAAATTTATTAAKAAAEAATKAAVKAAAAAASAATTTTECTWLSRGCDASTQKSTVMGGLNDKVIRSSTMSITTLILCQIV
jgi:hypothetical protein